MERQDEIFTKLTTRVVKICHGNTVSEGEGGRERGAMTLMQHREVDERQSWWRWGLILVHMVSHMAEALCRRALIGPLPRLLI